MVFYSFKQAHLPHSGALNVPMEHLETALQAPNGYGLKVRQGTGGSCVCK